MTLQQIITKVIVLKLDETASFELDNEYDLHNTISRLVALAGVQGINVVAGSEDVDSHIIWVRRMF